MQPLVPELRAHVHLGPEPLPAPEGRGVTIGYGAEEREVTTSYGADEGRDANHWLPVRGRGEGTLDAVECRAPDFSTSGS